MFNTSTDPMTAAADGTYLLGMCDGDGKILDPAKGVPNSFGHIMLTEPGTATCGDNDSVVINASEATGAAGGYLRTLNFTILNATKAANGTVFQILRGSPDDKLNVRIARLKM